MSDQYDNLVLFATSCSTKSPSGSPTSLRFLPLVKNENKKLWVSPLPSWALSGPEYARHTTRSLCTSVAPLLLLPDRWDSVPP